MKIALNFKYHKEEIIKELEKRNFEMSSSSMGCIWVYGIRVINYLDLTDRDGFKITLEREKDFEQYSIYLEDLEYFEIHSEE